jgi:TPR repeat protein
MVFSLFPVRIVLVRLALICAMAAVSGLLPARALAQDLANTLHKAQAGDAKAQYQLALDYYSGTGVAKDPNQGLSWLRKSADRGYDWAQKALGVMYRDGDPKTGISKNPHEAAVWFRKAARQQNTLAQTALTQMLTAGLISRQEASWHDQVVAVKSSAPKPFSLGEVEKGLSGGITCKRLAALIQTYKVDFALTATQRQRLGADGADDNLLTVISASKRSL